MHQWLTIVGLGEDGVQGLGPAALAAIAGAQLVAGGARHLALAAPLIRGERLPWPQPLESAFPLVLSRRGTPVVVLGSGDPHWFGIGATLARLIPPDETTCIPAASSFALACARLGWALQDVATISFCGRPVSALRPLLQPGARVLALSADAMTPAVVGALLAEFGFGASKLHLLEALGGAQERHRAGRADAGLPNDIHPLNLVAIEVVAAADAPVLARAPGLPEALFEHDNQITKREVRAATIAALAPRAGEILWDIGCGSGSVAIEWMLCNSANRAIGIEDQPDRAARARRNGVALGVPAFRVVDGAAPDALAGLPQPDAVFVGGGATDPGVLDAAWSALKPGGRMVVNAVTIETEALLFAAQAERGGTLTRLSIDRMEGLGRMRGFRPGMTVTQWAAAKPWPEG